MTNETVIAILSRLKECYLGIVVDALDLAIEAVKAQEPRVMTPCGCRTHMVGCAVYLVVLGWICARKVGVKQ